VTHLDAAGCSVHSAATLAAVSAHLEREASIGGYPAAADVVPVLDRAREHLGALVGLSHDEVGFVANATDGFAALFAAWPLPSGARVACSTAEYASNAMLVSAAGARGRVTPVLLAVDDAGVVDLDALDRQLDEGLDLLLLCPVASHRGVVQPTAEVVRRCHDAGTAVILDVAQAVGQVDVSDTGADAFVAPSRKWLCGPRGVGFVAVRRSWGERLDVAPSMATHAWDGDLAVAPAPFPTGPRISIDETSFGVLMGWANALEELHAAGPALLRERIAALGRAARESLDGVAGWQVQEAHDSPSGSVVLDHDSLDTTRVHAALRAVGVVTSLLHVPRAPADLPRPKLRLSFHAYADDSDIAVATEMLARVSQ